MQIVFRIQELVGAVCNVQVHIQVVVCLSIGIGIKCTQVVALTSVTIAIL